MIIQCLSRKFINYNDRSAPEISFRVVFKTRVYLPS